jgi:hypothetical protein
MPRVTTSTALAILTALALTGCGAASTSSAEAPAPSTPTASPSTAVASSPVHGSWRLELTDEQLRASLTEAGFQQYAEEFLRVEEIEGAISQVLTVDGDRFAFAYQSGSQPWHVGWKGPVTVTGDTLTLLDDKAATTDTLRYTIGGDELTLDVIQAGDAVLKGIPNEAYLRAYLTSAPFVRTNCVPTEGTCTS